MDRAGLYRGAGRKAKQGLAPEGQVGPESQPMDTQIPTDPFAVTTEDQLRQLYDQPMEGPLKKVAYRMEATARAWIAASPFCVISTVGSRGVHATPRGDAAGFVAVEPDGTLGVATVMSLTLSVDHRVIDGALGANLLKAIIEMLETPIAMLA